MAAPYTSLNTTRMEIRVLRLESSFKPDQPLACTSEVVSILDKPAYTALSYCWGEPADKTSITFNGVPGFHIPRNLDILLRQLQREPEAKAYWADAICINQDPGAPEKSRQVAMMNEIYSHANSTIIWLGKEADDSDLAMDTIASLYNDRVWNIRDKDLSPNQFKALAALNARDWWSRTWVIQELLLSPNPIVLCGAKRADIEAFIHLDDLRRGYHRPSDTEIDNAEQPSRYLFKQHPFSQVLHHYFNDRRRLLAGVVNIEEWIVVVDDLFATDPRDKIYGLLGLGSDADRAAIVPDYSPENTVADVYCRATARFILQRSDLLHLQFNNANDIDQSLNLPSWCQDYSRRNDQVKERYTSFVVGRHEQQRLRAAGVLSRPFTQTELFPKGREGNWRELHLHGWEIDEVVYAGFNPYHPPYTGTDARDRLANNTFRATQTKSNVLIFEAEARRLLATGHPYAPRPFDEVFWRVPMANRDFSWNPVPDTWKEYFNIWLDRAPLPSSATSLADTDTERKRLYVKPYTDPAITRPHGRAFIVTKKGYLGLAPRKTKAGDAIAVVRGGNVPFLLRRRQNADGEGETWEFVGESFVMGLMEGEGMGTNGEREFVVT